MYMECYLKKPLHSKAGKRKTKYDKQNIVLPHNIQNLEDVKI